jgi:hypothetical protein
MACGAWMGVRDRYGSEGSAELRQWCGRLKHSYSVSHQPRSSLVFSMDLLNKAAFIYLGSVFRHGNEMTASYEGLCITNIVTVCGMQVWPRQSL